MADADVPIPPKAYPFKPRCLKLLCIKKIGWPRVALRARLWFCPELREAISPLRNYVATASHGTQGATWLTACQPSRWRNVRRGVKLGLSRMFGIGPLL